MEEYTRENVVESLRICARQGNSCNGCIYEKVSTKISCRDQLMYTAAAMLEEIGKGELPRKLVEEKAEPTMDELWIKHETLRGRVNVFSHYIHMEPCPTYDNSPDSEKEMKEEIAYYEGFCDAAIMIIESGAEED